MTSSSGPNDDGGGMGKRKKRRSITTTTTTTSSTADNTRKKKQHALKPAANNKNRGSSHYLKYDDGAIQFRQRIALSLLSHRPLLIRNIRADDLDAPGLREHEASYLRLIDTMTNGTEIEINAPGTQLRLKPGVLLGGEITHDCPLSRSMGWFLEGVLPLAMWGKEPLSLMLEGGITDGCCRDDPSPDYISQAMIPLLQRFGVGDDDDVSGPRVDVLKRGAAPGGGGKVQFYCPLVTRKLTPIDMTDMGKIKRVRGTAISCRISPSSSARVAHAAKGLLHRLLPDVWVHTDAHSANTKRRDGGGCGPSPGLGLVLVAKSTTGMVWCAECCQDITTTRQQKDDGDDDDDDGEEEEEEKTTKKPMELPEDLGIRGASYLLEEVRRGGCVDTSCQSLALILMCLGPEDVARIRLGTLSMYTISTLRLLKDALGVEFKVRPQEEEEDGSGGSKTVVMSCLGTGYRNMARAST